MKTEALQTVRLMVKITSFLDWLGYLYWNCDPRLFPMSAIDTTSG